MDNMNIQLFHQRLGELEKHLHCSVWYVYAYIVKKKATKHYLSTIIKDKQLNSNYIEVAIALIK